MERILITQLGFIGDVILSTPVIGALRENFPKAELTVLTTVAAAPLVQFHPAGVSVITYDKRGKERGLKGFLSMRKTLKSKDFDSVFSLHKSARTTLLHYFTRIPLRYGFKEAALSFLYSKTVSRKPYPHDVQRNIAILKTIGIEASSPKLEIGLSEETISKTKELIPQSKFVVIAPGSVWKTKRWTAQGFAELSRKLVAEGFEVVLIGAKDETVLGEIILQKSGVKVRNYIGELSLVESAAVLSQAAVVVSNDSSPLHLASTFNVPTVAIFCATVPEFGFGPYQQPSRIMGVDGLKCRPCGRHGGNLCPTGTHACQTGIKVDDIITAVRELSGI